MNVIKHYIIIFFISMVPLIELRGAIPYAVGFIKAGVSLELWQCYLVAILGNMLPVPFIFFFARAVLEWGKDKRFIGKFFSFCLEKGHKGGMKLKEKAGKRVEHLRLIYGESRKRIICCITFIRRDTASGNRSLDRCTRCKYT